MLFFTGFNGFQQFTALCSHGDKVLTEDIIKEFSQCNSFKENIIVSASWSDILVVNNNSITLFGFSSDKPGQSVLLKTPFKERIIQCAYGKGDYFFVTQSGEVWIFNAEHNLWKNISTIFRTEVDADAEAKPTEIIKVCCGETLTAAISKSGLAYCIPNAFPNTEEIKDVACGKEHGLLLTAHGNVLSWGGGSRGQLGHGDLECSETPREVEGLSGLGVVKIAAGGWHSAALTSHGDIYTWGWNKQGQLAFPLLNDDVEGGVSVLPLPKPVDLPEDAFVEDVSCGASHTVIKLKDGSILGSGWNKWGQLGLGGVKYCDKMTRLPLPTGVRLGSIHCGPWSTFVLA